MKKHITLTVVMTALIAVLFISMIAELFAAGIMLFIWVVVAWIKIHHSLKSK